MFPPELHTFMTHPRKILLVMLQIGKAKDLSAPQRTLGGQSAEHFLMSMQMVRIVTTAI
jgi:hypothetical protein